MSKSTATFALVCALVGLAAAGDAAYVHYRLLNDPLYTSFCDVSATVSCTQVYQSQYSTWAGVPVAIFGAIWFAFAALLSVVGLTGPQSVRENVPGYLFAGSTLALGAVLYFAYVSMFVLGVVCVLCLISHAATIALFVVSGAVTTVPMKTLPRRAALDFRTFMASPIAMVVAVLFVGGAATTLAFFPREGAAEPTAAAAAAETPQAQDWRSEVERFMATASRVPLAIAKGDAKVLVVKFNDYQCPACARSFEMYRPIFEKYAVERPGAVRLVLKDFPLDAACNPAIGRTLHPAACDAAVAVRLATARQRTAPLEEWLYSNQPAMTGASVRQAARDIGQVSDFDAKYAATLDLVKGDIALAQQLGIQSTPTFFINGVKIEGMMQPQYFDQAIAYELQHADAAKP